MSFYLSKFSPIFVVEKSARSATMVAPRFLHAPALSGLGRKEQCDGIAIVTVRSIASMTRSIVAVKCAFCTARCGRRLLFKIIFATAYGEQGILKTAQCAVLSCEVSEGTRKPER